MPTLMGDGEGVGCVVTGRENKSGWGTLFSLHMCPLEALLVAYVSTGGTLGSLCVHWRHPW